LIVRIRNEMNAAFTTQWIWLPFWYIFVLGKSWGAALCTGWDAVFGVFVCMLAACFMNYLMPGGAGPLNDPHSKDYDPTDGNRAWLPGGYNIPCALIYAVSFVYLHFISFRSTDTKRFCLGAYADLIVTFMNPNQGKADFHSVIFDYNFNLHWNGPALCVMWIVFIACSLTCLSLLRWPRFLGPTIPRSATTWAAQHLAGIAMDCGGLQRQLIAYYSHGASEFELGSMDSYIKDLKERSRAVDSFLEEAYWEAFGETRKRRLQHLHWLSVLLDRLQLLLQMMLAHVRNHAKMSGNFKGGHDIRPYLEAFTEASDILGEFASKRFLRGSPEEQQAQEMRCRAACQRADEVLLAALGKLQQLSIGEEALMAEMGLIDALREWATLLENFLSGPPPEIAERIFGGTRWRPHEAWMVKERHFSAIRLTTSWTLALLWSNYVQGYSSTCVVCLSFIFNSSLGKLWTRNVNRALGVTMGVILGNMPSFVFLSNEPWDVEKHNAQDYFLYLSAMSIIWLASAYLYFEGGSWSYAFSLLAGIGGVELLKPLRVQSTKTVWMESRYNTLMDTFMAVVITFIVDSLFAILYRKEWRNQVAESVEGVLDATTTLLQAIITWDSQYPMHVGDLRSCTDLQTKLDGRRRYFECVAAVESHDEEARTRNATWQVPYKASLVKGLLEQFETIRVATYCLRSSSERCDLRKLKEIIEVTLPVEMIDRCQACARIAKAGLDQTSISQTWGFHEHCLPVAPGTAACRTQRSESATDFSNMAQSFQELRASVRGDLFARMEESVDSLSESALGCSDLERWSSELSGEGRNDTTGGSIITRTGGATVLSAATAAATLGAMNAVLAVRTALERVEVLLRDEEFMAFGHWGFAPTSALEQLRADSPDKGHFIRRNWHVPIWNERPQGDVEREVFTRASQVLELRRIASNEERGVVATCHNGNDDHGTQHQQGS